jgi:hypothetical protein
MLEQTAYGPSHASPADVFEFSGVEPLMCIILVRSRRWIIIKQCEAPLARPSIFGHRGQYCSDVAKALDSVYPSSE